MRTKRLQQLLRLVGNSFLVAIPVFLCVKVVQIAFRRNRVMQIGIGGSGDDSDD